MSEEDLGRVPEFSPCESWGHLIPTERAYADTETLTVLCPPCFREKLRSCEECGKPIRAAAYQHLSTGRVLCEPSVVKEDGCVMREAGPTRKRRAGRLREIPSELADYIAALTPEDLQRIKGDIEELKQIGLLDGPRTKLS